MIRLCKGIVFKGLVNHIALWHTFGDHGHLITTLNRPYIIIVIEIDGIYLPAQRATGILPVLHGARRKR